MEYLSQKAAPWVSIVVMGGGLLVAFVLVFLFRVETASILTTPLDY